ncbi:hypothetical protein [Xanthomonas theicola]|uniref:hypothetical protein n=1 Tax=Xanthomonas theicola TaxID=56464 RepID=UPI001B80CEEE
MIQRLVSFPNVIVTGHQAFFTEEAIGQIMAATLDNIAAFERGAPLPNRDPAAARRCGLSRRGRRRTQACGQMQRRWRLRTTGNGLSRNQRRAR